MASDANTVVVIGAGMIGVACALQLQRRGRQVTLIEAGAAHRLRDSGWLFLYRSEEAFAGSGLARATYERFGIASETLDARQLSELEPSLLPVFAKALWIKDAASVDSPGVVVEAYAALFVARGGTIERRDVRALTRQGNDWRVADADGKAIVAREAVIALGPWARDFLRGVGLSVPMAFERGYHVHYAALIGAPLNRPIYDTGGGYALSPMEQGLRLTTGVELTNLEAARNLAQLTLAEQAAKQAFPPRATPRIRAMAGLPVDASR